MVAIHRLTISHFLWCPIWGSSANQKKMSWKNEIKINEKYNLFDWKAQVQWILSWCQNSRDFAYFILRLVWHWCGHKKGRNRKEKEKKAEMKKVWKKFNDEAVNVFLYIITYTDQTLSGGSKESQNYRAKSSNKNNVANNTKFYTEKMNVNIVDGILQSTWCTFDITLWLSWLHSSPNF